MQYDTPLVPYFRDVLGQVSLRKRLIEYAQKGDTPHALLFVGEEGSEALSLAWAFVRYLECDSPDGVDACGKCQSCLQLNEMSHPEVHIVAPIIKRDSNDQPITDHRLDQLRQLFATHKRVTLSDWKSALSSDNRQPQMYIYEAEALQHKLSYKSYGLKPRIVFVWLPELMNNACANALLKLIEEPPEATLFVMVSSHAGAIIPTIYSRLQRIRVTPAAEHEIIAYLSQHTPLPQQLIEEIAHIAQGNLSRALALLPTQEQAGYFDLFTRACEILKRVVGRDPKSIKVLTEELHKEPRANILDLLEVMTHVLREVIVVRHSTPEISYYRSIDARAVNQLAQLFGLEQIPGMIADLVAATAEIVQNAMIKIVLFDLFLNFSRKAQIPS